MPSRPPYRSEYALEAAPFCNWVSDENPHSTMQDHAIPSKTMQYHASGWVMKIEVSPRWLPYEEARAASGGRWQIRDFIISILGSSSTQKKRPDGGDGVKSMELKHGCFFWRQPSATSSIIALWSVFVVPFTSASLVCRCGWKSDFTYFIGCTFSRIFSFVLFSQVLSLWIIICRAHLILRRGGTNQELWPKKKPSKQCLDNALLREVDPPLLLIFISIKYSLAI